MKILLENGTDLESRGNLDQTSPLRAAAYEHKMVAKEKGSFRDNFGRTPLLQAAANGYNHLSDLGDTGVIRGEPGTVSRLIILRHRN